MNYLGFRTPLSHLSTTHSSSFQSNKTLKKTNKVSNSSSSILQKLPTKTGTIPTVASNKFKQDNGTVKVDYRSVLHPIRSNNEKWSVSEACKAPHICPDCQAEISSLLAEIQALKALLLKNKSI